MSTNDYLNTIAAQENKIKALEEENKELKEFIKTECYQTHNYCEDGWYSCPKAEDGCGNEDEGEDCTCGADKLNEKIDKLLAKEN